MPRTRHRIQPSSHFPDELIALPPNSNELHARTWLAIKGRCGLVNPTQGFLHVGAYRLHHATSRIWLNDAPIEVTSREFALAWMLFANLGVRLSRDQISAAVWSTSSEIADRTLEQHVYKVRKKLQLSPQTGVRLRTLYSMGYKLELWSAGSGQNDADSVTSREDTTPQPA